MTKEPKFSIIPNDAGKIKDLPPEILEDVRKSFVAYFNGANIDDNGWDVDRGCKVIVDAETGNHVFCKLVVQNNKTMVAVLHLEKTTTDSWMQNTDKTHCCWNHLGDKMRLFMIVCPQCGNKRCPKATDCSLDCTNSNEPGQPGSIYGKPVDR